MPLNQKTFTFQQYTPAEFEEFKKAVQADGFIISQNTIDTISGHLGALVYLTGNYNRNQNLLSVVVKTSPWQSFQESDLNMNVLRVSNRKDSDDKDGQAPINSKAVTTPKDAMGNIVAPLGTNKNVVVPAIDPTVKTELSPKSGHEPSTPTKEEPKPITPVVPQTPKPADPIKPTESAKVELKTEESKTEPAKTEEVKPAQVAPTPSK